MARGAVAEGAAASAAAERATTNAAASVHLHQIQRRPIPNVVWEARASHMLVLLDGGIVLLLLVRMIAVRVARRARAVQRSELDKARKRL